MSNSPVSQAVADAASTLQLLVFSLCGEEFAFGLTDVREIIALPVMTDVPNAPSAVRGVFNLRGKVVTAIELSTVLGFSEKTPAEHVVVAEIGNDIFGLIVDGVTGVLRTAGSTLRPTPDFLQSKTASTFVKGVLVVRVESGDNDRKHDNEPQAVSASASAERTILLLDIQKILSTFAPSA